MGQGAEDMDMEWARAIDPRPRADLAQPKGRRIEDTSSADKVAELVEALRAVINALHDAEKALTEELHHMEFCGESLPLCNARAVLAKWEAGE